MDWKERLAQVAQDSRRMYASCLAGSASAPPWWTVVAITAGSRHQAESYEWEIRRRQEQGKIPASARYVVVPDPRDRRVGSGGATMHALHAIGPAEREWWDGQRVLLIHSGGDSRRLPQYSLAGKLFSALPVKTPWGDVSTVFDETLALSTAWVRQLAAGLVACSGDVVLTFDAAELDWDRPGVCGVAIRQPADTGTRHGVYVADEHGRVYAFLQKPSVAEVRAAGGLLSGGNVALDAGLLRFDAGTAARLARLGDRVAERGAPVIDLYQHVTMALTGQWQPRPGDHVVLRDLAEALRGIPFWCSLVDGDFTHIGTTSLFRKLLTEETDFSRLYAARQRLGASSQPGLRSSGVVVDSAFAQGGDIAPGAVAIECNLTAPVTAGRGSVLHGLEGIDAPVEVPDDTVVHQLAVRLPNGAKGVVIRVYGVEDDAKRPAASAGATWFGRPLLDELKSLGLDPESVWAGIAAPERTLWNAALFPVTSPPEAWQSARWLMRLPSGFTPARWRQFDRLSLATSAQWADTAAAHAAHAHRMQANWRQMALSLAESGADIRPLLAHAPGISALAEVGRALDERSRSLAASSPTEAASRACVASLFHGQAGLEAEAQAARDTAFRLVEEAVRAGGSGAVLAERPRASWCRDEVRVSAPARLDFGGGWSDTPPFCLDWGGTVLNAAVELAGEYPAWTSIRRLREPVIRCYSGEVAESQCYRDTAELLRPASPGDPFSIPRTALGLTGLFGESEPLDTVLEGMGGGLELRMSVDLPMGSGLGTSSILAATTLRALAEMLGVVLSEQQLSDFVMDLEQRMTTGGGWQDQAGAIYPGAKLVASGPGLRQRLRVQPVDWDPSRREEFESLLVLFYTGIRRIAKGLLQQVVGSYLARETATVQVLHSIKTLAGEMAYAMREGEWDYLGQLLDRHWALNQVLDPNTTNAPINALLALVRPYIRGAKLAGAGGGGFLMMLARSPEAASELRAALAEHSRGAGGAVYGWKIAGEGLRVS